MNAETYTSQNTDIFDLRTGMDVYTADGEKIGNVLDIAGFGSIKSREAGEYGTEAPPVHGKTGTGYFTMAASQGQGMGAATPLHVPFHGIQDVVTGHGMTLNGTILAELRRQRGSRPIEWGN